MSTQGAEVTPQAGSTGLMIRTLMGIAMLSGFLVVMVYQITKPMIEENQRIAIEAAVFQVVPGAVSRRDYYLSENGLSQQPGEKGSNSLAVYAGYDADGRLKGIAAKAGAQGYADMIHLLYGYDPACRCIRGIKVLKLAETPGLGDKIITDADFVANFNTLEAGLSADGKSLAHPIETVKHGAKHNAWEIDAISGATISSKAVGKALNQSAQALLPRLVPQLDKIQQINPPSTQGGDREGGNEPGQ